MGNNDKKVEQFITFVLSQSCNFHSFGDRVIMTDIRWATDVRSILVSIEYFIEQFFVFFVAVDIFLDVDIVVDVLNVADLVDLVNVAVVDKALE